MNPATAWALGLYRRSVLKQAKFRALVALLGDVAGKHCLDLGGDSGIISYLLRQRGGHWSSADLGATQVAAIRELVGERVWELHGPTLPFPTGAFDVVVVVDLLEHVDDDVTLAAELGRVVKPGGTLLVHVPHVRPRSLVNRLRTALGLTDARHGHVRPGYTIDGLDRLLRPAFEIEASRTYSKAGSELVDIVLNATYAALHRSEPARPPGLSKGPVITRHASGAERRQVRLLSVAFPFLWLVSRLDGVLFWQEGYRLIVRARRVASRETARPERT